MFSIPNQHFPLQLKFKKLGRDNFQILPKKASWLHGSQFKKLPANCFQTKLLSEHGLCIPSKRKKLLEERTNKLKRVIRYFSKYEHSPIRKQNIQIQILSA